MPPIRACTCRTWHMAGYATAAKPSASKPALTPPPSYKASTNRISRHPEYPDPEAEAEAAKRKPKAGLFARLWPSKPAEPVYIKDKDPERGIEASQRVVREGVLDPRYKRAARSYTAIIISIPIIVATSYELWQRRFNGKERKRTHQLPTVEDEGT